MASSPDMIALAARMARTCSCNWSLEDRQRIQDYLVSLLPEKPTDLALRVEAGNTTYRLVAQRPK